jgi:outer membrane protein
MMPHVTNLRLRAATALAALIVAYAFSPKPSAQAAAAPVAAPTPFPVVTLGPVGEPTSLPYPAYGSPVPGVNAGTPGPGLPPRVTLQQAADIAFARSPILTSARADLGVQAALVRLTRSGLLPSLSGSASTTYDRSQNDGSSGAGNGLGNGSTSSRSGGAFVSNSIGATLQQLIFDGGRVAAGVQAAQRNESAFADVYRRDLQTVTFNVAVAYYAYLDAERLTQVDLEIVRSDAVQEDLVRAQVGAGTAAAVDVATAGLPVAQARVAVVKAQGAELAAQAAFSNAMGLDANINVQPIDDTPGLNANSAISTIAIPTYVAALQRALLLRPDYDSSLQLVEAQKASLRAAKLGLFPTLSGTATYGDSSTNVGGGALRNAASIGASLSIPLFDQGITSANSAEAQANLDKANSALQTEVLGIQLNVKQALTNLVSARAQLDQTQAEFVEANAVLQSTEAQYRAGVTTLPLLLNAETGLTQALTDQVTAVYNLRQAEQTFLYAEGANYQGAQH